MAKARQLNPQQQQAARHQKGPMLVVAGAGTGKTQVITHRINYLINRLKVPHSQVLGITFTEKAAREMEQRVSDLSGKYILDVNITTFNAFGNELLKRFAFDLGLGADIQLMNTTQQIVFLREHIEQLGLNYYAPVTNPESMLAELIKYFSKLKSQLITPDQYKRFVAKMARAVSSDSEAIEAERHQELAKAYQGYQQLAKKQGLIDYDDQIYLAVELLERRANVRARVQSEITYLPVDEFQDTNKAQSVLVDLLAEDDHNVMVVGDDDQAIYKFRGAALANILEFKQRYPDAKQLALVQNYRSSQAILDSAYQLIQHNNPDRLEARYKIDKHLKGQFVGKPPQLKSFLSLEEEAAWIAGDIKRRLKAGQPATEIAVLLRKNSQARVLEKYLQDQGVDFLVIGQNEDLYRQPQVKLVLNFLRAIVDPGDSESLYHLLVSPVYELAPAQLRRLVAQARRRQQSLEEALAEADEPAIATALEQIESWRNQLSKLSVGQLSYRFLEDSGYLHALISKAKDDPDLDQGVADLNQFFTTLLDFERIAQDSSAAGYINGLPALLGSGERLAIEDLPEVFGEKVRLLTVHKAKGLEFETVYLFDLTQGTFPARPHGGSLEVPEELSPPASSLGDNPQLQEERRLMYVAITRAKKDLIMSYSIDHGGKQPKKPSRFIGEALGEFPLAASLGLPKAGISQIELFKDKPARAKSIQELPPQFWDGDRLVLTEHQIEDYLMCPAEFKLRHLIGPPQPQTFALEYGNIMHSLIQFYNRRCLDGQAVKLEDLQKFLEGNWPREGFLSPGHQKRSLTQATRSLRRFYKREQAANHHPRYIERNFAVDLAEIKTVVKGRFDAVYEDEEGAEIRDYKTGAATVTQQDKANSRVKDSLQLGVYALAWQRLGGRIPDRLTLDFIDSGLIGQAAKSERQLQTVFDKIKKAADGIRAGDFKPGSSHLFCSHQEYGF